MAFSLLTLDLFSLKNIKFKRTIKSSFEFLCVNWLGKLSLDADEHCNLMRFVIKVINIQLLS